MAEREKSAAYPGVTINDCLDFIKTVDSFKTNTVSYKTVAEKYGLTSITTKSFTAKIGASKQYGLISTSNSTIQLTDLAKEYLYPTSNNLEAIKSEMFKQPPLYQVLIEEYEGKAMPDEQILANLLLSKYSISRAAKDTAARVFINNANDLGVIKAGVLSFTNDKSLTFSPQCSPSDLLTENDSDATVYQDPLSTPIKNDDTPSAEYITQLYPVESGKVAKIIIPIDAKEDDLYAIRDLLEVVMRRKFKMKLDD